VKDRGCSASAITLSPPLKVIPKSGTVSENHPRTTRLPLGEMGMATHAEVQYATATGNDYPAHEQMYRNFVTLVKVSLAVIVVILILMGYFLT
jgi:aa3 type cytochrome c oxidase subunit IV